jgi:DNA-binding transcriptional ArsR family regulator
MDPLVLGEEPVEDGGGPDRLLADPTRLAIMSVLVAADWCDFTFVRDAVGLTDSALSKQLTTLRKSDCVEVSRTYRGQVPRTRARATEEGRGRLLRHVRALQRIVENASRSGSAPAGGDSGA